MNWYLEVLKKYAVFDGRARRQEYWMFVLINFCVTIALLFLDMAVMSALNTFSPFQLLYALATLIPGLAVSVRRLHDTGRSGLALFIALIPFIGGIILLVWMATEGDRGRNKYGPDPKARKKRRVDDYEDDRQDDYEDDDR